LAIIRAKFTAITAKFRTQGDRQFLTFIPLSPVIDVRMIFCMMGNNSQDSNSGKDKDQVMLCPKLQ